MLLPFGQLAQPIGDPVRLVELAELGQRLDELGRDREHPGLVDTLALRVLPDRAQALGGPRRLVREQRRRSRAPAAPRACPGEPPCPRRGRSPRPPTAPPPPGAPRPAASSARQRSYVGKISSSPVGGLGPLVEQARRGLPVAGAQLELAHVQSLQGVRDRLAALVGERQQPGQDHPRAARPRRARRGACPRPARETRRCSTRRPTPQRKRSHSSSTGQPAHAARPGERVEREALRVGARALRGRQRLERQRLGLGDPRDGAAGGVAGLPGQHVRAHLRDRPRTRPARRRGDARSRPSSGRRRPRRAAARRAPAARRAAASRAPGVSRSVSRCGSPAVSR